MPETLSLEELTDRLLKLEKKVAAAAKPKRKPAAKKPAAKKK